MHWLSYLVPLLFGLGFLARGTHRNGGFRRRYVYTGTRERGTPTPGTDISAGCNSDYLRGIQLVEGEIQPVLAHVNSFGFLGLSTFAMDTPGVSGEPPESAA